MKKTVIFIIVLFVFLSCQKAQAQSVNNPISDKVNSILRSMSISVVENGGKPLKNVTVIDMNGRQKTLHQVIDENPSKVLVINLFATWCPYCRKEMQYLNNLHDAVNGVTVIALDCGEEYQDVNSFMKSNFNLNYPIIVDPNNAIMSTYGFSGLPTTLIVTPNKKIAGVKVGYFDWSKTIDGFSRIINILNNR